MSQNKTIVLGTETEATPAYEGRTSDYYERGNHAPVARETYVGAPAGVVPAASETPKPVGFAGKPVVGFLYSISRTAVGEYWPLHIGVNTIGSSAQCDVQLCEATVSEEHAELVVRLKKKPASLIASITDAHSTNGTMINDESLGFSAQECFNGDVIVFGENYKCVLLLIDPSVYGLEVCKDFIATGVKPKAPSTVGEPPHFPPVGGGPFGTDGDDRAEGGTVGM